MSNLIFDKRDWKFLMREHLEFSVLASLPNFADYDMETFEAVFDEAVKFAVSRVAPLNPIGDAEGCQLESGRVRTPRAYGEVWEEMRRQGWNGAVHSPEFGGQGLPYSVVTACNEAFNGACQAFEMFRGLTSGAGHLIESFGTDDSKSRFVARMYSGEFGGTMCLTEPQAGSAVGDVRSSATPQGDGTYHIRGNKIFISAADADFYANVVHLVLARIEGDPPGTKGLSLFAVPRLLVADDGSLGEYNNVEVTGLEHKMGIHGSPTCSVSFGDPAPSVGYLVGARSAGMKHMFQMMNEARIACGLQGVAVANAAYQQAVSYAKERRQGPPLTDPTAASVQLVHHPDVRRNLMWMKVHSEGIRALVAKVALSADLAGHSPDPAVAARHQDVVELLTPIAKAYSTDKAFRVAEIGIQIFGGYGYCAEYPMEQYLRDAKIGSIYEGTNGIQAMDLLGRKMRLKGGALFMNYIQALSEFIARLGEVEALSGVATALSEAQGALGEAAFWLSQTGREDRAQAFLQATPFLELFGDVVVGHLLAEQALIAVGHLEERFGTALPERALVEEDDEATFYFSKVMGARFFASEILVLAPRKAVGISSGEQAAFEMVF